MKKNILGEMSFDSSLFNTFDKSISSSEYRERLVNLLQPILNERFSNEPPKTKIYTHIDRISFACPYCGDSMQNSYKKRGNFILSGKFKNHFKCHNCGQFKRIDNFFSDFNKELKLDTINYMMEHLGDFTTSYNAKYDMSALLDMDYLDKYAIDRQELKNTFNLIEVKNSPIWPWLTNRYQFKEDKFLYNKNKNYLLILNLTQSGKILGVQKRIFKNNNRFETYKLSKLYELMKKSMGVDDNKKNYLDALSMIFNICLIDFSKNITLFEGPMDSFLYKNSIANTGANKEMPIELPVQYLYDYDKTGREKSLIHLNKNQKVFLWEKFINDFNLPYRNKWDWNDVIIWFKKNKLKLPFMDNYFSDDPLDAIDI